MSNKTKVAKEASSTKGKDNKMKESELEKALARNDEEWMKRMLLLIMTMIIALLGID